MNHPTPPSNSYSIPKDAVSKYFKNYEFLASLLKAVIFTDRGRMHWSSFWHIEDRNSRINSELYCFYKIIRESGSLLLLTYLWRCDRSDPFAGAWGRWMFNCNLLFLEEGSICWLWFVNGLRGRRIKWVKKEVRSNPSHPSLQLKTIIASHPSYITHPSHLSLILWVCVCLRVCVWD